MDLDPCIYCRGEARFDRKETGMVSVKCKDCGAHIGEFKDEECARLAWNLRPTHIQKD